MSHKQAAQIAIIGAGFCGLAAGYELSKRGARVTLLEQDADIGGLAGSFRVNGVRLEKFYHHWFTNDQYIMALIDELGARDQVVFRLTRTGMYYANDFFKLSTPLDVLRFKPLSIIDRFRLGFLVLKARQVEDWHQLEHLTAATWLQEMGGDRVYKVVWEPLLRGKFGEYAEEVSAVWFWNKLKLRGGSRGKGGEERLAYYRGGFAALAEQLAARIKALGGQVRTNARVEGLIVEGGRVTGVKAAGEQVSADIIIATPALPIIADLVEPYVGADYMAALRRIKYLANVCLVLELDRSLSNTYWLNINDPDFPFVGVIEHTNFEPATTYRGRHIVYLSKYLPASSELYCMSDTDLLDFTWRHLKRMFPVLCRDWLLNYHVWQAQYAQPIVERHYSKLIPAEQTPLKNLYLATMAQIYPEDRGTNYAVREGLKIARKVLQATQG